MYIGDVTHYKFLEVGENKTKNRSDRPPCLLRWFQEVTWKQQQQKEQGREEGMHVGGRR